MSATAPLHRQANEPFFDSESRKLIRVTPYPAARRHRRLFQALEAAYPVAFAAQASTGGPVDGLLVLGGDHDQALPVPDSCAVLVVGEHSRPPRPAAATVEFEGAPPLAYPLRARTLEEEDAPTDTQPGLVQNDVVLASRHGDPVWWRRRGRPFRHESAYALSELGDGDTLRGRLRHGCFMGLLPLLHLVWHVCGDAEAGPRPLRASFVIDDPNLHSCSYGHLRYSEVIRHAALHGYHLGVAMVPLDAWLVSARAASLARASSRSLSVLVHGNDHTTRELERLDTDAAAARAIGQAVRRIARFETRCGIAVTRVMAPPHGACSEAVAKALFRLGFEAACVSRPYPWRDRLPPMSALDGWFPAEIVAGGLPVLPRYPLGSQREELIFRALLGQPLILYGHHGDLAEGLERLEQAADYINRLGTVTWGPLDAVAQRNYLARREGELLRVQLHSRRVTVDVPSGVWRLVLTTGVLHGERLWELRRDGRESPARRIGAGWESPSLPVVAGSRVEIRLDAIQPLELDRVPRPLPAAWPLVRRVLVEGRDRVQPAAVAGSRMARRARALR